MKSIFPQKLNKNSLIMVIAPSKSLSIISEDIIEQAKKTINDMNFRISISKNAYSIDEIYDAATIEERVLDLHDAFKNKNVDCILTAIGGFNSNQILDYIDYELIQKNPKIICGFSDITVLLNAIYAKTGVVTYYGPHFSSFGMKKGLEYTKRCFVECLTKNSFFVTNSSEYSDDKWYLNQNDRNFIKNDGMKALHNGYAEGTIIGGNLCTFNLLQGTKYMPKDKNIILFLEDDNIDGIDFCIEFDRNLESILQTNLLRRIKGIIIGRAQVSSNMTDDKWLKLLSSKRVLSKIPIVYNADFGHTTPIFTFPIGGICKMNIDNEIINIQIENGDADD